MNSGCRTRFSIGMPRSARALESEHAAGGAIEPDDLAMRRQQHGTVRQCRGQAAELPDQPVHAPLVELLAPVDARDDADDVAPEAADVGRILMRAMAQPVLETEQVGELPGEHAAEHDREAERDAPVTSPAITAIASAMASRRSASIQARSTISRPAPTGDSRRRARSA